MKRNKKMAVKSVKMPAEEVSKREMALREYMEDNSIRDHMDGDWLLSVAAKIESESVGNDVVITRKECRIFYERNKKRILRSGSTKKQAMWLALSDYCLEKRTVLV